MSEFIDGGELIEASTGGTKVYYSIRDLYGPQNFAHAQLGGFEAQVGLSRVLIESIAFYDPQPDASLPLMSV